jgi:hypothetical protein
MNKIEALKRKVAQSIAHRWRNLRGTGSFDLKAQPMTSPLDKKVQFGPGMGCPEETLFPSSAQSADNLLQDKPFPRGAKLGMDLQITQGLQIQ